VSQEGEDSAVTREKSPGPTGEVLSQNDDDDDEEDDASCGGGGGDEGTNETGVDARKELDCDCSLNTADKLEVELDVSSESNNVAGANDIIPC
jgi:hypothetical protein